MHSPGYACRMNIPQEPQLCRGRWPHSLSWIWGYPLQLFCLSHPPRTSTEHPDSLIMKLLNTEISNHYSIWSAASHLGHVGKCEVCVWVFLILLYNFKEPSFPLFSHLKFNISSCVIVQGEGKDQGLSSDVFLIWKYNRKWKSAQWIFKIMVRC